MKDTVSQYEIDALERYFNERIDKLEHQIERITNRIDDDIRRLENDVRDLERSRN